METKIKHVNELMELLGVTREDVIKSWITSTPDEDLVNKMETLIQNEKNSPAVFGLSEITKIEPGMIWYEDDTFSFSVIKGKKIKAVVELIDTYDNFIYGDLTASTIYDIQERRLSYEQARQRIENLFSICKEGEQLIIIAKNLLYKIASYYDKIEDTLIKIGKEPRKGYQLSYGMCRRNYYITSRVCFDKEKKETSRMLDYGEEGYFRPVLQVHVERSSF
ncbi:MAG: hypothetical protein E7019_04665 [Alphaproteobacteria bacterium]|nr:hypothetical protein [Alphaproteobacteria bacterium]